MDAPLRRNGFNSLAGHARANIIMVMIILLLLAAASACLCVVYLLCVVREARSALARCRVLARRRSKPIPDCTRLLRPRTTERYDYGMTRAARCVCTTRARSLVLVVFSLRCIRARICAHTNAGLRDRARSWGGGGGGGGGRPVAGAGMPRRRACPRAGLGGLLDPRTRLRSPSPPPPFPLLPPPFPPPSPSSPLLPPLPPPLSSSSPLFPLFPFTRIVRQLL